MIVLQALLERVKAGDTCVLATVVKVEGSAPRKDNARMLVDRRGERVGTVGGGQVETEVLREVQTLLGGAETTRVIEIASHCGGNVTVMLEKFAPPRRLVVIGAGHVGRALAILSAHAGYSVTVVAPGAEERLRDVPEVATVASADPTWLDECAEAATTHLVVATGDREADIAWAVNGLKRGFGFVGVVGSASKAAAVRHAAVASGLSPKKARSARCPVGLEIGGVTPEEIAVSIVAELIRLDRTGEVPDSWRRASRA